MITPRVPKIIFGGDYFPEQWSEKVWQEDIHLMKEANLNMVSIAIFSWALLQPDEDTYTFEWLDKIMDLLAGNGIYVCLGTPTAAQPIWMTRKYDDILPVRESGERVAYGSRQAFCINSPSYRKYARKLAEQMAQHYKDHRALALWHINNEYGNKNSMCFCKNCEKGFQKWLKNKYKTLDNFNRSWGTYFWSEKYFGWEEINSPQASAGGRNGAKLLDYKRFLSESFFTLYLEEFDVIRRITPNIPITTNFEGDWSKFDHSLFKDHLDFVSWDCYPDPAKPEYSRKWVALRHSMMRSLLGKPFMLMEQAPSQVDWYPVNINKRPGMMRLWSYQALAHGSDSVMFFQWRASKKGAEKYHSAMVPHYGKDSRVFREICALGNELEKVKDIVGSTIDSQVAILMDNDSWWSVDNPYGSGTKSLDNETFWAANGQPFPTVLVSYFGELEYYFNAFYDLNVPVDVIPVHYDFSKYKIVVAPLLHMIKLGFTEAVEDFVKKGGIFITTYFTGLIDESVGVFLGGYPGPLKKVMGIKVEEYDPLLPDGKNAMKLAEPDGFKKEYGCSVWCDVVHPTTAKTLATFVHDYYAGYPCVTENKFSDGKAYYVATRPDKDFMNDFLTKILKNQGITPPTIPQGVELVTRKKDDRTYHFYLNHEETEKKVKLPDGKYEDILTGVIHHDALSMTRYGVSILTKRK